MAEDEDTMRPEYDFSDGVRGVTARRYALGATVVAVEQGGGGTERTAGVEERQESRSRARGYLATLRYSKLGSATKVPLLR